MRRIRWCIALWAGLISATAIAHETDQYSLPVGREFADLRYYFSEHFHDAVKAAMDKTNARIAASLRDGRPTSETKRFQTPDYIANAVLWEFPPFVNYVEMLEMELRSGDLASWFPGLVVIYLPAFGIYSNPLLLLDPTKFARWWRSSTLMIDGVLLGTDKIVHFVHMGYLYFATYRSALSGGASQEESVRQAVDLGIGANPISEKAFLGFFTTGVISNADLAANYVGMKFFINLTEPVQLRGQMHPPMLERDGEFFRLAAHVNSHTDFFKAFVSDHWNEAFNPNAYQWGMGGLVQGAIAERCDDVLDWYRTPDGRRMTRSEFAAKLEEMRTYFGENYGNDNDPTKLVSPYSTCFDAQKGPAESPNGESPDDIDALGRTALWRAARAGDVAQVQRLLDAGADVSAADVDGETPLHAAARAGAVDVVRLLLSHRVPVAARSRHGATALHLAARENNLEVVRELLAASADANARDAFGCTPLHDAAGCDADLVLRMLLDARGNASARDDNGVTPLHRAARAGAVRAASLLRAAGASPTLANNFGHTPIDDANRRGYRGLAAMLSADNRSTAGAGQRSAIE